MMPRPWTRRGVRPPPARRVKVIAAPKDQRAKEMGAPSSRYTSPIPHRLRGSPGWIPVLMVTLFVLGGTMVILNYLGVLPASPSNLYGVAAGALAVGGLVTATRWR